jgi:hypothetical protein
VRGYSKSTTRTQKRKEQIKGIKAKLILEVIYQLNKNSIMMERSQADNQGDCQEIKEMNQN